MSNWTIGIDFGGTKIEIAEIKHDGSLGQRVRIPTLAKRDSEEIIRDIENEIKKIIQKIESSPQAVGIGFAGQIEKKSGKILFGPNVNWHDIPLADRLQKKISLPVFVINDVRAATVGEWFFGQGKGFDDFVCLFLGTGIGSGVVSGGKLLEGADNTFGEIGHMIIDIHGPPCTCGSKGCFESLAGGWGIAEEMKREIDQNPKEGKAFLDLIKKSKEEVSAKDVIESIQKNSLAENLIKKVQSYIVAGCINIVNVLNPKRLIIGGGLGQAIPDLIKKVEQGVKEKALKAASKGFSVVFAELGNDAGVIGAGAFARQQYEKKK